ncbi:ribosomal protein S18-alanine N-acetyltransferase [Ruixingdingia sedimenti]|uniref:[Ribosomal protein bS18]-alanine N-acetyltransferase n=1 Tax=Ruixingdingia sedimenti TaxID=3073604 RepID=A0ABU1FC67_9RHOB|nr:ribosomal protein S18-alanine N-acetyltransferase [Xinfangfangia sp. LG-4]MDR5654456.1 ribosomal protein S18-alanine N-acetyltransferase [Xinfangfangia sp. LG-4]
MTPGDLAAIHGAAFTTPPPWSAEAFAGLLASPGSFVIAEPQGFALGRVVLDEAELLTIAVTPEARRQGIGARLLAGFTAGAAARGAARAFLEVAASNTAAIALYSGAGWRVTGRRRGYYHGPDGAEDAVLMARDIGGAA